MKKEIVKWVSLLMSSLPCRLPSGVDIKLALEGYAIALEGCDMGDLEAVVKDCIKGKYKLKWAPAAPELAQLVRDEKARRLHPPVATKKLAPPVATNITKRSRKAIKLLGAMSHEQWVAENIRYGTIKPYAETA